MGKSVFVTFTNQVNSTSIDIVVSQVTCVERYLDGCAIFLSGGAFVKVQESRDEVKERIQHWYER